MPQGVQYTLYGATFIVDSLWGYHSSDPTEHRQDNATKTSYVEKRLAHNMFQTRSGSIVTVEGVPSWEVTIPKRLQTWDPPKPIKWFRVDGIVYAPTLDEYDVPRGPSRPDVYVSDVYVVRVTPKGCWLDHSFHLEDSVYADQIRQRTKGRFKDFYPNARFQANASTKKYANPTLEGAYESFLKRKEREVSIYQARIRDINKQVRIAEHHLERLHNGN